jgi:hypothetical protein
MARIASGRVSGALCLAIQASSADSCGGCRRTTTGTPLPVGAGPRRFFAITVCFAMKLWYHISKPRGRCASKGCRITQPLSYSCSPTRTPSLVPRSSLLCSRPRGSYEAPTPIDQEAQPATEGGSPSPVGWVGQSKLVTKNYAVGLEISCPGGGYCWAPEIPSPETLADAVPGKCELAHNRSEKAKTPPGGRRGFMAI